MLPNLLRYAPVQPPVNVQTNTKGLLAWFTQDHLVGIAVMVLCVMFVWSFWKMLKSHPVLLLVLVLIGLAVSGVLVFHPGGHAPAPIVPLPKGH